MSAENKAIARRLYEDLWNKGNLAVADEISAANYVHHDPATPDVGRGPEGLKQLITMYRTAFPDVYFTIDDLIAEGGQVVTRWTARGTHKGALMGISATGKQVTVTGIGILRIAGGKIEEGWENWDAIGMMQQLGVVPQMTTAGG